MYHVAMMRGTKADGVARALGDATRIRILVRLLHGPATVVDLVAHAGSTQPNVSNHLAVLRDQGLVRGARTGRQVRYRLASASVAQLVEAIVAVSTTGDRPPPESPLVEARTCYDHLAGRLGVALLAALVRKGAIASPGGDGVIDLGRKATAVFGRLGVDLAEAAKARRRFAFACLDWTERRAHLGGALGAAVASRLLEVGWVQRQEGTRALLLTTKGRRGFRALGIS
jgi:DNA-binding transcriptional ArsR family regulator